MIASAQHDWQDSSVVLWDVTEPARPARTAILTQRGAAFAPTGPHQRARRSALTGHGAPARTLGFNPDGTLLATGSLDTTALLWDVTDPAQPVCRSVLTHPAAVPAVEFSPDGRLLATGGDDATVRLWTLH